MFEKVFSGDKVEIVEGEYKGQQGEYYDTSLEAGYLIFLDNNQFSPVGFSRTQFKVIDSPTTRNLRTYFEITNS